MVCPPRSESQTAQTNSHRVALSSPLNYHLSASTSISFDISFLFLNITNGNSLYEIIGLDYQCFALPLHSKENTHGTIQEDKRHIQ